MSPQSDYITEEQFLYFTTTVQFVLNTDKSRKKIITKEFSITIN